MREGADKAELNPNNLRAAIKGRWGLSLKSWRDAYGRGVPEPAEVKRDTYGQRM